MMKIKELNSRTILNHNPHPSNWFGVHYAANFYRGCPHRCIYCDSRSACYRVEDFDNQIEIKINALELLQKELRRKRKKGTVGFGAMSDPYLPLEIERELTRGALQILLKERWPVFILTKSHLVQRDLDLLSAINKQNYACVAFSITTTNDDLAAKIEPYAPRPSERFKAMSMLSCCGIHTGAVMMPLLPFIEDDWENVREIADKTLENGGSFLVPSYGVTLRDRQRDYFYDRLDEEFPGYKERYKAKYRNNYGCTSPKIKGLKGKLAEYARKQGLSLKMPSYETMLGEKQLELLFGIKNKHNGY